MDKKFLMNISGKDFVKFEGLLAEFHSNKGKSIETVEVETSTGDHPKFKATVTGEKGSFTGHGDADASNVNAMVKVHKYRMAETRAIARALRWYNNIGMCSFDELGGDNKFQEEKTQTSIDKLIKRLESLAGKKMPDEQKAWTWAAEKIEEKTGINTDGNVRAWNEQDAKNILEMWQ